MYFLPATMNGLGPLRLPLAEPTAAALLTVLAEQGTHTQAELLAHVLAHDPPFTWWALQRASHEWALEVPSLLQLATWLAPRLARELSTPHAASANTHEGALRPHAALAAANWAYAGVLLARVARLLAPAERGEQAYVLGLVWNSSHWANQVRLVAGDAQATAWPRWMQAAAAGLPADMKLPEMAAVVAAHTKLAEAVERSPGEQAAIMAQRKYAEQVRGQWLAPAAENSSPSGAALLFVAGQLVAFDELRAEFEARLHQAKMAALRELAYGATHEINNPLANISTRAQALLREEKNPERRRMLETMNLQALRAHEMIADLMHFARPPRAELASVQLAKLIQAIERELADQAREQHTKLVVDVTPEIEAWADATQLGVAVKALCVNALEALGQGGEVRLTGRLEGPWVVLEVADNGRGYTPREAEHLFDPFFSGREAGRGLGFGLTKAWRIANALGGNLTAENLPTGGARFTLRIPSQTQ